MQSAQYLLDWSIIECLALMFKPMTHKCLTACLYCLLVTLQLIANPLRSTAEQYHLFVKGGNQLYVDSEIVHGCVF